MTGTPMLDTTSKNLLYTNPSSSARGQEVKSKDSFSELFDKTRNTTKELETKTYNEDPVTKDSSFVDKSKVQEQAELQKSKTAKTVKEQPEEAQDPVREEEEIDAAVIEAAAAMMEQIAETFEVPVEEVQQVLEDLGMSELDLLNGDNLTPVVLALNPGSDALTLMTNEELYTGLKDLMGTAQELTKEIAEDWGLTDEEMSDVLTKLQENVTMEETTEEIVQPLERASTDSDAENSSRWSTPEISFADTAAVEATVLPKTEQTKEARHESAEQKDTSGQAAGQNVNQNFVDQLSDAVENASGTQSSYGVSGQDIMEQITEHIRVNVKQDTTEMELQLHPASLGNVKVQITSAGGVMTAVFTTENEAVKAALESQLLQLKENFEQQGLKVESVEVNVSAQGFERSLDQQEQEQNRFEENKPKRGNRRIHIHGDGDIDDVLMEGMDSADQVVADMMIRNGNTVDYTV